ncbi:MAG TPA: AAA family ATPase [Solirubrobacteraceae bacterium]|jgi:predicted ATPase|nr:AAA family ATPase [Solirubrobacteraceae bacterium]
MDPEPFIRSAALLPPLEGEQRDGYPWDLPVIGALAGAAGLALHAHVTYLVGENGSGKSTLVEAIAVAAGMNPEGGGRNFDVSTRASHSELGGALRLVRGARRPRTDFFLRAESLYTNATYLENLPPPPSGDRFEAYGGRSLHEQSHGESFLAVLINRFGPDGLYLLDEPEAALSPQNCLTFLRRMDELVRAGSQFVVATHSPIVLAYPGALIYECGRAGVEPVAYDDAEPVRLMRAFLGAPDRFVERLFE